MKYDLTTKTCECLSGFERTTDGCRNIKDMLGENGGRCVISGTRNETTQVEYADSNLTGTGEFAYCRTCSSDSFEITERDNATVSLCNKCDSRFDGCDSCTDTYCRKCSTTGGFILDGIGTSGSCRKCSDFIKNCGECRSKTNCDKCKAGTCTFFGIGDCEERWGCSS